MIDAQGRPGGDFDCIPPLTGGKGGLCDTISEIQPDNSKLTHVEPFQKLVQLARLECVLNSLDKDVFGKPFKGLRDLGSGRSLNCFGLSSSVAR